MTLDRLIEGAGTGFERELLQSARTDSVPDARRARVAERLGFSYGAVCNEHGSHAKNVARAPIVADSPTSVWLNFRKYAWLALAGGAVAVSLTTREDARPASQPRAVALTSSATTSKPESASAVPVVEPAAPAMVPAPPTVALMTGEADAHSRQLRPQRPVEINRQGSNATTTPTESRLMDEVVRLDMVRAALRLSACQVALARLGEYSEHFPKGELALEATMLRLQALTLCGRAEEAGVLARALLSRPGTERYQEELTRYGAFAASNPRP